MEDGNETSGGTQFSDARKLTNHTQHIETAITMHAYSSGGDNRGALHPQAPSPAQGKNQPDPNPAGTTMVCLSNGHPAWSLFVSPRFTHF